MSVDYAILGGGCAGLSLAYQLETRGKLQDRSLVIVEPREHYRRDKTWSFWKVRPHDFEDCVIQQWQRFQVRAEGSLQSIDCGDMPYQSIDSGLFYDKVLKALNENPNVSFVRSHHGVDLDKAIIFNSVPANETPENGLWQHFKGVEVETVRPAFNPGELMLMDFDCEQRGTVHFFYILPFSQTRALVETTWIGPRDVGAEDYDDQLSNYIEEHLDISDYDVTFTETGAIPLWEQPKSSNPSVINIGGVGGMVRRSTGYAFQNIQHHSEHLCAHLDNLSKVAPFSIGQRYQFLDRVFLRVLRNTPEIMPNVFRQFFQTRPSALIPFLSNCGSLGGDASAVWSMPKAPFIRALAGV